MSGKESKYCIYYAKAGSDEKYEIHAKKVVPADLIGFVKISDFYYPHKSSIIIEPDINKTETEFKRVKSSYIPIRDIIRIDELTDKADDPATTMKVVQFKSK